MEIVPGIRDPFPNMLQQGVYMSAQYVDIRLLMGNRFTQFINGLFRNEPFFSTDSIIRSSMPTLHLRTSASDLSSGRHSVYP